MIRDRDTKIAGREEKEGYEIESAREVNKFFGSRLGQENMQENQRRQVMI